VPRTWRSFGSRLLTFVHPDCIASGLRMTLPLVGVVEPAPTQSMSGQAVCSNVALNGIRIRRCMAPGGACNPACPIGNDHPFTPNPSDGSGNLRAGGENYFFFKIITRSPRNSTPAPRWSASQLNVFF
jgi:hypothetical protein